MYVVKLSTHTEMKHSVKISPERRKDKSGNLITTNVPIFADIKFSGNRLFYFTGYRVDTTKFNTEAQEVKKNASGREGSRIVSYSDMNRRFKAIKAALELHFQSVSSSEKKEVVQILDDICYKSEQNKQDPETDFFVMFEKYIHDAEISDVRKRNIRTTLKHWRKYVKARRIDLQYKDIDLNLLNDFAGYIKKESTRPKAYNSKIEILSPKSRNSVHKNMTITRAFWNYLRKTLKEKGLTLPELFGRNGYQLPGEVYGTPIYISNKERNILFCAELSSERLERVRDLFVFQCFVGMGVGDFVKLTKNNLQGNTITYIRQKTKKDRPETINIPLHPQAIEILKKYDLPDGRLLPFICDQRYNVYLKELFREVGLTRIVTRLNPHTEEPEQVRLCDIVSSHMARKTFAGNLYGKVDRSIITSMTGHSPNSKAFTRYYDVNKELQEQAISKF